MKRDAVKLALQDWKSKWIPAILEYGRNCRGNFLESAQKEYEGMLIVIGPSLNEPMHNSDMTITPIYVELIAAYNNDCLTLNTLRTE